MEPTNTLNPKPQNPIRGFKHGLIMCARVYIYIDIHILSISDFQCKGVLRAHGFHPLATKR